METGLAEIRDLVAASPRPAAGAGRQHHASTTCSRRTPPTCSRLAPVDGPAAQGRRRRRQRHGRPHRARRLRPARRPGRAGPDVLRARRHLPEPRGQPDRAGQPRRPAGAGCVAEGADIGLAFDGDADRCFLVDERGAAVSPSTLTALIAVPRARQGARRDGDPQPDHQPLGARDRHASSAASRCAPGSATPSSRRRWPRPARSSAASTAATSTSATSGAPTPACSPRCTPWPRSPRPTGRCPSCSPSSSATSLSGEINSEVADQAAVTAEIEATYAAQRRRHAPTSSTASPSATPTGRFNVRPSNTEPLLRLNAEGRDEATMARVRDERARPDQECPMSPSTSTPRCWRSSSARPAAPASPSVGEELVCQGCGLAYPVRDGIPVLLVDEARKPA